MQIFEFPGRAVILMAAINCRANRSGESGAVRSGIGSNITVTIYFVVRIKWQGREESLTLSLSFSAVLPVRGETARNEDAQGAPE